MGSTNPKFDELIVLVASKSEDDRLCGDKKLNKLLYFCETEAYRKLGRPLTGSPFQHEKRGPIASRLKPTRRLLKEEGRVETKIIDAFGYGQRKTFAKDKPDLTLFGQDELQIIDAVLNRYKRCNGREIEEISHNDPGWLATEMGQTIPIEASVISAKPSAKSVRLAKQFAQDHGW